jgi:uncharacterized RDD family membrane protein YckC
MAAGVITPEAVLLELPTAGVATRSFARLVDLCVQGVLLIALSMLATSVPAIVLGPDVLIAIGFFVVLIVFPIGLEVLWRGRSVGKWVFGLRVVSVDGATEVPRQAVVRGLVALVDIYASLGSVALGTAMFSPSSQRSGDVAAGTVVIRVRGLTSARIPIAFHPPAGYEAYVASLDVGRLSDEDFSLIREFLLRAGSMTPEARGRVSLELADAVLAKIGHTLDPHEAAMTPATWLVCVASAHQLRTGGLLADAAIGLAPLAVPTAPMRPTR